MVMTIQQAFQQARNAPKEQSQPEEAITAYHQAIALDSDLAEVHCNLGNALKDQGRLEAATEAYRQAIALAPDLADAHLNLGMALLVQGNFHSGWAEYEWRWRCKDFPSPKRDFKQPQWDGGPLEGRTLLLHAEQGAGDALQFLRYLPLVAQRGGRIIIECHETLAGLLKGQRMDHSVVAMSELGPTFDLHCPLLTLPHVFATDLASIPQDVPYLQADAAAAKVWNGRLAEHPDSVQVGLVWAGNPKHKNDRNRSVKLASLAPLADIPGVSFISLQKGAAATEAMSPPPGMKLSDWTGELEDFAHTAALIAALDLVITVDTSVAHLAGALGKPVWVFLPFAPDWRWLLGRSDSPWYPTMRLFRQPRPARWDPVITEVRYALETFAAARIFSQPTSS